MNQKVDAAIARQWRELGFWYDYTPDSGWMLRGSSKGLERLAEELNKYAADPRNEGIPEHEHLGPHEYLKLVTWAKAEINADGIYGSLQDMRRLAAHIRTELASAHQGSTLLLAGAYAPGNTVQMVMHVEGSGFDPAEHDVQQQVPADGPV